MDLECERNRLQWEQDNEHLQCSECGVFEEDGLQDFNGTNVCEDCFEILVNDEGNLEDVELKDSFCRVKFYCTEPKKRDCVYFMMSDEHEDCKYLNRGYCESAVAQVNRMTVQVKEELK